MRRAASLCRQFISLYNGSRVPQAAACLAYFLLLTIFPILICVTVCLGMIHIDISSLPERLHSFLPAAALDILNNYLRYVASHRSPALAAAALAGCWFSAAAAFRTITGVMRESFPPGRADTPGIRSLLFSFLSPMALLIITLFSMLVLVTGHRTIDTLAEHLPFLQPLPVWTWLRYLFLFAAFCVFLIAILMMAAPRGTPRFPVLLGSVLTSGALAVSSALFSWFVGLSTRYSLIYGSMVSIIILMVWLYLCGQVVLTGIVFTGFCYHMNHSTAPAGKGEAENKT